jgi:hypothetical protein
MDQQHRFQIAFSDDMFSEHVFALSLALSLPPLSLSVRFEGECLCGACVSARALYCSDCSCCRVRAVVESNSIVVRRNNGTCARNGYAINAEHTIERGNRCSIGPTSSEKATEVV